MLKDYYVQNGLKMICIDAHASPLPKAIPKEKESIAVFLLVFSSHTMHDDDQRLKSKHIQMT